MIYVVFENMHYLLCSPEALLYRESEKLTSQSASHQLSFPSVNSNAYVITLQVAHL